MRQKTVMTTLTLPPPLTDCKVEVHFSRRKSILISIHTDGKVIVKAPGSARMADVEAVLTDRAKWIERHLIKARDNPRIPVLFEDGATHFYLGDGYPLSIRRATRSGAGIEDGVLVLRSGTPDDPEQLERILRKWLKKEAERILTERLSLWEAVIPGLPDYRFRLRWMRSRWGSCTRSNSIAFNTQLVKAPLSCIDYVVVHELCHTLHHDHGPGFKQLLARVMPDWKAAADRLKNLPVLL